MKNWCCKLQGGPDSCLVDCKELLGCATKGLKPNEDQEFLCGSHGHIINMRGPTEVAGDDDTQESGLVYYFEWLTIREVELGEEVKLLGKIEGYDFRLLMVYFHLVFSCEQGQVCQLVLENGLLYWKSKARYFVEVRGAYDRESRDKH